MIVEARRPRFPLGGIQSFVSVRRARTRVHGRPLFVADPLLYGAVGGTIKAAVWTGSSRGLTAAMFIAPGLPAGIQTATIPRTSVEAYQAYRGIACSGKYYQDDQGPDFDFSVGPLGGSLKVSF